MFNIKKIGLMKKWLVILAVCALPLTVMAQVSALVGAWQQLDASGRPTHQFKFFMPDGKLLGLSYSSDLSNSSVWFMSDYRQVSDSTFVDHAFYHCEIGYQRDYLFTFHQESDSVMVTRYTDYRWNGMAVDVTERWKKTDRPLPEYSEAEWQALHRKSLAEFDRLPQEGETTEQLAQRLYDKAQGYKRANRMEKALEALLTRAELDTTNLKWQTDAIDLMHENKMAPSVAEKIFDRFIRLKTALAAEPNDTSVVSAWRSKAYMYNYRGSGAVKELRETAEKTIAMERAAGHQPSKGYGLDYFLLAESYVPEGNFEAVLGNAMKSAEILEQAPDSPKWQTAVAYMTAAFSLSNMDRDREALDMVMNKVVGLYQSDQSQGQAPEDPVKTMAWPLAMKSYETLLGKNPKDKELMKAYREFLEDKVAYAVFNTTDKKRNLFGKYMVLERGVWTLEHPTVPFDDSRMLLEKDGEYTYITKEKDEEYGAQMLLEVVDKATKKEIIRQWKAYKKR